MEIKFLKGGTGDSILINHNKKNILIDGGNYPSILIQEYNRILSQSEKIDLLIITHHDDDHILGILKLFAYFEETGKKPMINFVIFNSTMKIKSLSALTDETTQLNYKQSKELEQLLLKHKIDWHCSYDTKAKDYISKELSEFQIQLFSPDETIISKYVSNEGTYLNSDYRCDWGVTMKNLYSSLNDKSLDKTNINETSIVLLLKFQSKTILLSGDVTPRRLSEIITTIDGESKKVKFDLIKLPHHGSYRSLDDTVLKKISCSHFIISTNGNKHYHPNKRTFLKIFKNHEGKEKIKFYFNYGDVIPKLNITKPELLEYKLELIPNNQSEGYVFNF